MTDRERMLAGKLYYPPRVADDNWEANRAAMEEFNALPFVKAKEGMALLRGIFGTLPEDAFIAPPFYCDRGPYIHVGNHFYANTGLLILDEGGVTIGDNVMLAPRVSIYTATHPIDAIVRSSDLEYAKGVTIGNHVWIGGNAIINPGVTIGNNVIIGSGSVVTKDIPDNVIAAGNPCRVIREITDADRDYWQAQKDEYDNDTER